MSVQLSMSKLGLAHRCAYGFRRDVPAEPRAPGRAAQLGSIVHALVEAAVNGGSECADVDPTLLAEGKAIFEGPLTAFVASHDWTICERGYRYDAERDIAVDGPRRGESGYESVPSMVVPGTVDLVKIEKDAALVVDVKTGQPPKDSEQLYGQAVAISRRFGVSTVRVQYARSLKTKLDVLSDEVLDADRLDAEAGRIRRLLRTLPTSRPNRGEHCWICSARGVCPEWRNDGYFDRSRESMDPAVYDEAMSLF